MISFFRPGVTFVLEIIFFCMVFSLNKTMQLKIHILKRQCQWFFKISHCRALLKFSFSNVGKAAF
jgi:hypothetical protein